MKYFRKLIRILNDMYADAVYLVYNFAETRKRRIVELMFIISIGNECVRNYAPANEF